ncbi:hypothetical protein SO802_032675 [Lithocarpus litseifolius]|uniref:Uncharacterized protein n=1 Tax=Lithocarpus litseifolius TaxID=425828 RepID=A0AAW2BB07_9ROSI
MTTIEFVKARTYEALKTGGELDCPEGMDSLKNKQAAKKSQEEIKKATMLKAQGGGFLALPPHVSKKRKYSSDLQSLGKATNGSFNHPETRQVVAGTPCHRIGKGLMTSQGPVVPPPLHLLVKDKKYAIHTTHSVVRDADLDECSKHETGPLGDSGLYDVMSASIKLLKNCLESEGNSLKKFKESSRTLGQEVIELKAKLRRITHQGDELVKENANLKSEVATLYEHMDKVKEKAIEEFQVPQPYFNKMGGYYGDGFKDFRKQAIHMFPNLDFSQIQIKLNALTMWRPMKRCW